MTPMDGEAIRKLIALVKWIWAFPLRDALIFGAIGFALCRAFPWSDRVQGWIWTGLIVIIFFAYGYLKQADEERRKGK